MRQDVYSFSDLPCRRCIPLSFVCTHVPAYIHINAHQNIYMYGINARQNIYSCDINPIDFCLCSCSCIYAHINARQNIYMYSIRTHAFVEGASHEFLFVLMSQHTHKTSEYIHVQHTYACISRGCIPWVFVCAHVPAYS